MEINMRVENDVLILTVTGELMGGPDTDKFRKIIDKTIQDDGVNVVVDMSHINWMNSSGLGLLISGLSSLRSSGGDLRLACLSERLRRPLQITKLDAVFEQFPTVEEAVQSYK